MKIILVVFLIASQSYAACRSTQVDVYFANGMFNDKVSATKILRELEISLYRKHPQDIYNNFAVSYNTNEFILFQMSQIFHQKADDKEVSFWKWLDDFSNFKDSAIFKEKISKILFNQRLEDKDLRTQVARYKKSLDEKHAVITVAHSQGNFYTNFAFETLNSDKSKMVSVATPANSVYGNGPYFTFKSDGVIAYVPTALPPNIERAPAGFFDHEFVKHYLGDRPTEEKIMNAVHAAYRDLNTLNEEGLNSDLDLVINWFETNQKKKRSIKMSDCLLMYGIYKIKSVKLDCEAKNYSRLLKYLQDCRDDQMDDKKEETSCPFWRGMDVAYHFHATINGFPVEGQSTFLDLHPHCVIGSHADFMSKIKESDTEEAISTLSGLKN